MLVTKYYKTREDGVRLVRTFSDIDHYIERDGVLYCEAIDPEDEQRVYTESDTAIPQPPFGIEI